MSQRKAKRGRNLFYYAGGLTCVELQLKHSTTYAPNDSQGKGKRIHTKRLSVIIILIHRHLAKIKDVEEREERRG